jgi:hypothetical protein
LPESLLLPYPELFTAGAVGTSYKGLASQVSMYTQRFLKSSTFFVHDMSMKGKVASSAIWKEMHPEHCPPTVMRRL